ncbi:MAG: hypothetical protein R6U27_05295 [Desulfobacterales bacterium]
MTIIQALGFDLIKGKKNYLYNFQINLLTISIDTEKGEVPPSFTQAFDKNRKYMKTFSSDINIKGSFEDDDVVFTHTPSERLKIRLYYHEYL